MGALDHVALFESRRRFLLGLAYRLLGSYADAEDAVQDTFLKWREVDRRTIVNPSAWLTTTCTRHCIDLLRSAQRNRVAYVGTWLPEPVTLATDEASERAMELAASLSTAFLLLLERLTPKERAAYLLHEIFELGYPEVAAALGMQEAACRKLVSRARSSIGQATVRQLPPRERQDALLAAFQEAVSTGATARLTALLADDIVLSADGGGKVPTIAHTLRGVAEVLGFITDALHAYWAPYNWQPAGINGSRGALLLEQGCVTTAVSFSYDGQGRISGIYIIRNPDKLRHLSNIQVVHR